MMTRDDVIPGLYLYNRKDGGQTWYLQKRIGGKVLKFKMGDRLLMDPLQARAKAVEMLKDIEEGRSPIDKEKKLRSFQLTVGEVFEQYYEDHLLRNTARPKEYRSSFDRLWDPIKGTIVGRLETHNIQRWVNKTATMKGGPTANKQLEILKACLRWGVTMQIIKLESDPTAGVNKFEELPYERFLLPEEAPKLTKVLQENPGDLADVVWIAWFTGARQSNIVSMRWDEIDIQAQRWDIPANKAKGKRGRRRPIHIALTNEAMAVLSRRQNNSEWVFPNPDTKTQHMRFHHKAWDALRKKAGLGDIHFHALRHTVGTWLGMSDASTLVIQRALGHSTARMSERYTHFSVDKIRQSIDNSRLRAMG